MKMKVLASLHDIRTEVDCVKSLYQANPTGCYFLNEHKGIRSEEGPRGKCRVPVVELRDWNYEDLFELIKLTMNVPEQEIDDIIDFLKNVEGVGEWRPLVIEVAFVVFEVLSQDPQVRNKVATLVNCFQKAHGYGSNPTEWGAFWIGQE